MRNEHGDGRSAKIDILKANENTPYISGKEGSTLVTVVASIFSTFHQ